VIPPELRDAWPCWYAVAEGLATMTEVTTTLDVDDVLQLCLARETWPRSTYLRGGER
jgi:hypothetical protein